MEQKQYNIYNKTLQYEKLIYPTTRSIIQHYVCRDTVHVIE